eukprot:358487-Chlamydomonas_euryale.AAC.2
MVSAVVRGGRQVLCVCHNAAACALPLGRWACLGQSPADVEGRKLAMVAAFVLVLMVVAMVLVLVVEMVMMLVLVMAIVVVVVVGGGGVSGVGQMVLAAPRRQIRPIQ